MFDIIEEVNFGLNALRYILNYFKYPNNDLPNPKD